jgi:hypothetical protein
MAIFMCVYQHGWMGAIINGAARHHWRNDVV